MRRPGKPERAGSATDDDDEVDEDQEMEGQLGEDEKEEQRRRLRRELDQGMEEEEEQDGSDSEDEEERGRGGARQPKFVKSREPLPEIAYPGPKSARRQQAEAAPAPAPTPAPQRRGGPSEPAARPPKKPKLTEKEVEAIREKKAAERREWGKRGAKGQPKLGGRVEQLLGRIQRSMA